MIYPSQNGGGAVQGGYPLTLRNTIALGVSAFSLLRGKGIAAAFLHGLAARAAMNLTKFPNDRVLTTIGGLPASDVALAVGAWVREEVEGMEE